MMLPISWGHFFSIGLRALKREKLFCVSWITVSGWRQDSPLFWHVDKRRLLLMSYPFHVRKCKVALMCRQRAKNSGATHRAGWGWWVDPHWAPGKPLLHTSSVSHTACKEEAPRWSGDGFPYLPSFHPWSTPTSLRRRKQEQCHKDSSPFSHHLGTGDASSWTSSCLHRWENSLDLNS